MPFDRLEPLTYQSDLDARHRGQDVLLFKHSPTCGVSARAYEHVEQFHETHPDTPVYLIDVIHERAFSLRVAGDYRISHASPQVILVRDGRAVWSASHWAIDADAIGDLLQQASA